MLIAVTIEIITQSNSSNNFGLMSQAMTVQNFVDDLGCAFALDQLDAGYLAPPGLHLFGANNVFQGPVCPLGQDMGPKELNQVEGGRLAELGDKIDKEKAGHQLLPLGQGNDGPTWLDATDRFIGVQGHH